MKNCISIALLFFFYCSISAQDSLQPRHKFIAWYYPTAHISGDLSLGLEHQYKKRLAHELSFQLKVSENNVNYFDKGYGIDYLLKYYLVARKRLSLSSILAFGAKDVYCRDKVVSYYQIMDGETSRNKQLYAITREDRRLRYVGAGLGLGINIKLYKRFYIAGDVVFYFTKGESTFQFKELIFLKENPGRPPQPLTPYYSYKDPKQAMARLKFGFMFAQKP